MREVTASGRPATTPRGGVVPGQAELVIWAGHEPSRFGTRDSYLSPSRTFLLVRHGKMKVQSLPFTGRPFVEACQPAFPATCRRRVAALHRAALR